MTNDLAIARSSFRNTGTLVEEKSFSERHHHDGRVGVMLLSETPVILVCIALGSLIVGVALQRLVQVVLFPSSSSHVGPEAKPMTYSEAMGLVSTVPKERRRRRGKKARPEPVSLSALRYGEYHTDDARLKIEAWRPDPAHRLAGHVVIDIMPREAASSQSVRRLAIDLETVEATKIVELNDGAAVVLAVRDYEVKGQGIIFKDLSYSKGIGVDATTLYVVLVVTAASGQLDAFDRLARGLSAATTITDVHTIDVVTTTPASEPPFVESLSAPPSSSSGPQDQILRHDLDVASFFARDFISVFTPEPAPPLLDDQTPPPDYETLGGGGGGDVETDERPTQQ